MDKLERAELYSGIFTELEIKHQIDDDTDIHIQEYALDYYFIIPDDPDDYYKFILPRVWNIESNKEYARALHACNTVNERIKVCKAFVSEEHVWLAVEIYLVEATVLKVLLPKLLLSLRAATVIFAQSMQENDVS